MFLVHVSPVYHWIDGTTIARYCFTEKCQKKKKEKEWNFRLYAGEKLCCRFSGALPNGSELVSSWYRWLHPRHRTFSSPAVPPDWKSRAILERGSANRDKLSRHRTRLSCIVSCTVITFRDIMRWAHGASRLITRSRVLGVISCMQKKSKRREKKFKSWENKNSLRLVDNYTYIKIY